MQTVYQRRIALRKFDNWLLSLKWYQLWALCLAIGLVLFLLWLAL